MKKIKNFLIKNYHSIIVFFIVSIISFLLLFFNWFQFFNIFDSFKCLINTIVYFFQTMFLGSTVDVLLITDIIPTYPGIFNPSVPPVVPGIDYNLIYVQLICFLELLIYPVNWIYSFTNSSEFLISFLRIILILVIIVPLFVYLFSFVYETNNKDSFEKSKPLRFFNNIKIKFLVPVKVFIVNLYNVFINNKYFKYILLFIFLYSFGFISVIVDLFSVYFYFISSFDFVRTFGVISHSFDYLIKFLKQVPLIILVVCSYFLFDFIRKSFAYKRIEHMKAYDSHLIDNFGVVTYLNGAPGSGKNLHEATMIYLNEKLFRFQARDIFIKYTSYFPNFDFDYFLLWLNDNIKNGDLNNRFKIIEYFESLNNECFSYLSLNYLNLYSFPLFKLFHYDDLNHLYYNNNSTLIFLPEALSIIAQSYLIYSYSTPLSSANYSIRFDFVKSKLKEFPLFKYPASKDSFKASYINTQFCHILDFDSIRLGIKQSIPGYYLKEGAIGFTEAGKERGNQFTQFGSKDDNTANQKNDKLNYYLKIFRHIGSLDNKCFVRFYLDEQRETSLEADARDIAETHIILGKQEKNKTSLFLYGFEELICDLIIKFRSIFFLQYHYNRVDKTFISSFVEALGHYALKYKESRYYKFGYTKSNLLINQGSTDNVVGESSKFYLPYQICYATRYSSDCYQSYFKDICKNESKSYDDLYTYRDIRASKEEFDLQHSYFIDKTLNQFAQSDPDAAAGGSDDDLL